ncbi:MAG: hydrophobic protein [Chloroflexi bacterium]|nr:MAG: hydrophobic protein [Chloroflexota bacterium]
MCALIGFLVLTAILFGVGFALHVLWWIALIALAFWLLGLLFRPGGGRWYYW